MTKITIALLSLLLIINQIITPSSTNHLVKSLKLIFPDKQIALLETECPICMTEVNKKGESMRLAQNLSILSCGHCFHNSCINKWIAKERESKKAPCPICMGPTTLIHVPGYSLSSDYTPILTACLKALQAEDE